MQSVDSSSHSQLTSSPHLTIEGLEEPALRVEKTILSYFETLNAGEFDATVNLFALDGVLSPPFESSIAGREAIAAYLKQEAQGMKLYPCQAIAQTLEDRQIQVRVAGKVQTSWFGVNVSWLFVLDRQCEIVAATVKLLASPQELLNLQR